MPNIVKLELDGRGGVLATVHVPRFNEAGSLHFLTDEELQTKLRNERASAIAEATEAHLKAERLRDMGRQRYRHIKRGGRYTVVSMDARTQCAVPVIDMQDVVVYQGSDGSIWVRPKSEFMDRFTLIE